MNIKLIITNKKSGKKGPVKKLIGNIKNTKISGLILRLLMTLERDDKLISKNNLESKIKKFELNKL